MQQCNNLQSHTSYIPHTITQYITWSCDVMAAKPQSCDVMAAKPQSPSHSVNGQASMLHIHHLYSLFLNSTPNNMATLIKKPSKKVETPFHLRILYHHLQPPAGPGRLPHFFGFGAPAPFFGNFGAHCTPFFTFALGGFCPFFGPYSTFDFFLMPSSGWRPPRPIHQWS